MRTSHAARNLCTKFISTFFAATLALGLVPAAAFAVEDDGAIASNSTESTFDVISSGEAEGLGDEKSALPIQNGKAVTDSSGEDTAMDDAAGGDASIAIPAASQRVNEDVTLSTRTVAQAESTRSYFLAQTLESTRTVPIVSANLPLDTSTANEVADPVEDNGIAEDEGGEDSDESDLAASPIAAESVVVGSFEYRGITYAVEPGGESVAVVAADYAKLPSEFIEAQIIVLPSMVTADGLNHYSVTRIANYAFSSLTKESANHDFIGGEALLSGQSDEDDSAPNPFENCAGILALDIPMSATSIEDDALAGFETLQYIVVSDDNPTYASYDGVLYDADLRQLRLIPEGRLGAVRIAPDVATIDPQAFSHCAVDTVVADADSAAYQRLSNIEFVNAIGITIELVPSDANVPMGPYLASYADYFRDIAFDRNDAIKSMVDTQPSLVISESRTSMAADYIAGGTCSLSIHGCGTFWIIKTSSLKEFDVAQGFSVSPLSLGGGGFGKLTFGTQGKYSWGIDPDVGLWIGCDSIFYIVTVKSSATEYEKYDSVLIDANKSKAGYKTGAYYTSGSFQFETDGNTRSTLGFRVTWNSLGGTPSQVEQRVVLSAKAPAQSEVYKKGYTLRKWNRDEVSNEAVAPGETVDDITQDRSYTAVWEPNAYSVTFDSNLCVSDENLEGLGLMRSTVVPADSHCRFTFGEPIPAPLSSISPAIVAQTVYGYAFDGYYDKPIGGKQYYDKDGNAVQELAGTDDETISRAILWDKADDVTAAPELNDECKLYAHWKYKVVLDLYTYDGANNVALNGDAYEASFDGMGGYAHEYITVQGKQVKVYTFEALDGESITLPAKVTRTGYDDATKWDSAGGRKGLSGTLSSFYPGTELVTTQASAGDFGGKALVLRADWTTTGSNGETIPASKTYTVALQGKYGEFVPTNSYTSTINALYDAPLLMEHDGKTIVYADYVKQGKLTEVTAPVIKSGNEHRYVFNGYYSEQNGLDMPEGGWNGTEYIGAEAVTGTSGYAGSNMLPTNTLFRTPNNDLVLYALWNRVESKLTLDLQEGSLGSMSGAIEVPDFKLTANEDVIELPSAYAQVPVREGYRFKGYYTKATDTDAAYATYAETATVKAYYKKNGSGVSAESAKWPFYANTVLYAHWEYDIECALVHEDDCASNPDGQHTATGLRSGFENGVTTDVYGNAYPESGTFGTEDAPYTIKALAGVPVKLPYAQNRNGYSDTDSWKRGSGTAHANASSGYTASAADTLFGAPSATDGKIVLRADWSDAVHTYTVNLIGAYDGYAPDNSYTTVMEDVVYGEPFLEAGESLVAPHIAGYRFMGYFTERNGEGEAYTESTDNSNKGQVGCLRVNGSPKPFTVAGLSNGDTVDLYASYERLEYTVRFNTDAVQPADATKVSSVVSELSSTRFSASELASYQGRLEANKHQATDLSEGFAASSLKLHYGEALAGEHALPVPALKDGRTATFWCTGYTFCGWYSFPIEEDGTLNVVYTEDGMVDLTASGAIRFKAGSYGSSHQVSEEKTSFDVELADVENPTMTLYAVWERNAYSITWDETSSLSTSSVTAPTQLAYQIALYGSKVERANPVFRDHVFAGTWHTSAACTGAAVVLDPYRPSASSSSSPVYFAKWDGTEEHAVFFYPGLHGSFEEGPYLEAPYLYADAASVPFGPYSQALSRDAGYAFAGWREAANAEDAAKGIVKDGSSTPINSLSGVSGFSTRHDDVYLVAQYSARTYVMLLDANGGTELDPSSIEFKEADEGPIALPGATDMKLAGSTFVGWESDGDLLATDEDAGVTVNVDGSASIDPHLFVSSMKDPTVLEIPLRAKWKPNAYVVRFNLWKDKSGEQGSTVAVSDVLEVPVVFGETFEMPYPAAAAGSKRVFSHWGTSASATRPDTTHTSWVPDAKVLFDADFLSNLKRDSKVEPVYDTAHDRYVLDLYAEFGRVISATLPTSASVHVDPHNPGAMIVSDVELRSDLMDATDSEALPVQVVSLSYNAIDGNGTQPGTRGAFVGSGSADASKVKLAVYAKVEDDAFKGFTDELRDAEFVRTSIVPRSSIRFALGDASDVRTLADLEQGGFAPFSKGKSLHIVYSLAFEDGYDESNFVTSLPDANVVGADGLSRDRYDIARVCYTIGYAPKTGAGA